MEDYEAYRAMFDRHPIAHNPRGGRPYAACGAGWLDLIDRCLTELEEFGVEIVVQQIKEKMGDLRLYIWPPAELSDDDKARWHDILDLYGARSRFVCETCGRRGKLRRWEPGPLKTVCDEHAVDAFDGRIAEPVPDPTLYRAMTIDEVLSWTRYDPDLDAWVPSEEPR